MPTAWNVPEFNVNVSRDPVPTQTITPTSVPDQKWRHVDGHGHGHFWDGDVLPTLEWVVTGTEWLEDGDEVEVGEHRCAICAEVVEPGMATKNVRSNIIYGPRTFLVSFENEHFRLSEAEYAECVKAWNEATRKIKPPHSMTGVAR
jgi:hypothetical protein